MRLLVAMLMLTSGTVMADESTAPPAPLTCKASSECPANSACSVEGVCIETSTPKPPPPTAAKVDAVVLKSGERVEGIVKEQVRGRYVVIESNGVIRTLMWDAISEVQVTKETEDRLNKVTATKPATIEDLPKLTGKPLKAGKKDSKKKVLRISTTTGFNANREGAGLMRTVTCKSNDDPTCKETMGVTVGKEGPKASYSSETDCSKKPGSDACTEKKSMGVSKGGFGVSYTKEELVAIDDKKRPSKSVNFGFTGLIGFGGNETVQILVGNFDANLKILSGGKFPSKRGGGWVGFAFEPTLGFILQSININVMGFQSTSSATGIRGGASAGLQLMRFGTMNDKTLKQRGIGLFVGLFAGYQSVSQDDGMGGTTTTGNSSVGPQFGLVFPNYNAGTAKYKSSSLNFLILPTGDFVFVSFGFATTF